MKVVWDVRSRSFEFGGMGRGARPPLYGVVSLPLEENAFRAVACRVPGSEMA